MLSHINFLPKATLHVETIYYKTVIPSVLYGMAVWGSCSDYLMKDLELIHLRAATLIHKLQGTKRYGRQNSTHKYKLDAIKILLLLSYSKYKA